uniref:Uncharacterized protein n=1 Tax=Knipowitschia caucasica TaxID=637954 RepID=A0AAV2MT48_KNICA
MQLAVSPSTAASRPRTVPAALQIHTPCPHHVLGLGPNHTGAHGRLTGLAHSTQQGPATPLHSSRPNLPASLLLRRAMAAGHHQRRPAFITPARWAEN